jgi:uncharacterized membrane protein YfcA
MNPIAGLLGVLGVVTAVFVGGWIRAVKKSGEKVGFPNPWELGVGYFTNFLDTLGIGSFATTTAIFRFRKMVDDRVIPGTLNVGHFLATVAQTFIYTTLIQVDIATLFSLIAASVFGAWLGAGIVARWPKRNVQIGMGLALLVAAVVLFMQLMQLFPGGGADIGVRGARLAVGVAGNFVLGALMTLGIGLYAPCTILVSLLGMNPKAAFPIMMGSCAFLMPAGSMQFIREKSYNARAALGLAIGGIPAVLMAAYIVRELPLDVMRGLVIVIVIYTSVSLLLSARAEKKAASVAVPAASGD